MWMIHGRSHGDHRAGRGAGEVHPLATEMVDQLDDVDHQAVDVERGIRVGNLRFAVATEIQPHDAKLASEVRHPCVKAARASLCGVQQYQGIA
jgi:hypothetical protein